MGKTLDTLYTQLFQGKTQGFLNYLMELCYAIKPISHKAKHYFQNYFKIIFKIIGQPMVATACGEGTSPPANAGMN